MFNPSKCFIGGNNVALFWELPYVGFKDMFQGLWCIGIGTLLVILTCDEQV